MNTVKIADKIVGYGYPVAIVAEIGNNHNGEIEIAEELIKAAASAGCDMAKIQTHITEAEMLYDDTVPPHFNENRWQFFTRMGLSLEDHARLMSCAKEHGIILFSSPFSIEAADLLEKVGVPAYKIASGEVTNIPMLEHIAAKGKPVIMSSGMTDMEEIRESVKIIRNINDKLMLMHCTSNYPCPYELMDLKVIQTLQEEFDLPVGYSDHSSVIYTSVAAVALGACMIERHFTLDKTMYGPDHKASLTPDEMKELVEAIRNIETAMGDGQKHLTPDAGRFREVFTKSIVSLVDIPGGSIIESGMVGTKKPGKGIPAARMKEVIGKKVKTDIPADSLILEEQIEWQKGK